MLTILFMQNNDKMLMQYLASRHTNPVDESTGKKPITEYFCKTCLLNADIEKFSEFEKNNVTTWTPVTKRKKVGVIFTYDSAMAEFHFKQRKAHDWGLYQPFIKANPE